MAFFEVEFPRGIGYRSMGGPAYNTTVNMGFSGYEQRNQNWATVRGKWTVDLTTPPPSQFTGSRMDWVNIIHAFFLNVGGRADAFRYFDALDHETTNEVIDDDCDGVTLTYQLIKRYTISNRTYTRTILKPVTTAVTDYQGTAMANTVTLYENNVAINPSRFLVDHATGIATFTAGQMPAIHKVLTADFQFHYPVRFDTDEWQMEIGPSDILNENPIVTVGSLPLVEVRS